MMEVVHPEIQVPDLISHIHREVSGYRTPVKVSPTDGVRPGDPVVWELIAANLDRAERHAYMGRSVPELKRVGRLTRWVGQKLARAFLILAQVITKGQREYNVATVQALRDLTGRLRNFERLHEESQQCLDEICQENSDSPEEALGRWHAALHAHEGALQRHEADLRDHDASLRGLDSKLHELGVTVENHAREERAQATALRELESLEHDLEARLVAYQTAVQDLEARLQQQAELLQRQEAGSREKDVRLARQDRALAQLKTDYHILESRMRFCLEEARRRLPGPLAPEQLQQLARERDHWLDSLYLTFENQFRGTREDIKTRLRVYLPRLRESCQGADILDVGCGRGEWLELMREEGFPARGVDVNRIMVEECRQRGLEAVEGEALAYLRHLPDACLGAVTGFHIIEHLPWEVFLAFLDETVRVLQPGGLAIFETPNPENLVVASCTFWLDPTHLKPLYPPTIQFMAEQRGLVNVEIWRLNLQCWGGDPLRLLPESHELAPALNPLLELAKQRFFAPPDFAVVGNKVK
jgi:O-antigen chain-terminating methyltransferase